MTRHRLRHLQSIGRLHSALRFHRHQRNAARSRHRHRTRDQRIAQAMKAARARWYGDFISMPCPACESSETYHNGTRNGKQRWSCRHCRRSFYGDHA
jgi:transposase-like protein